MGETSERVREKEGNIKEKEEGRRGIIIGQRKIKGFKVYAKKGGKRQMGDEIL
jgi:hypothetical protein